MKENFGNKLTFNNSKSLFFKKKEQFWLYLSSGQLHSRDTSMNVKGFNLDIK